MKAISLKAPGRAFNLPSMAATRAALSRTQMKFSGGTIASVGNYSDICSVFHLNQATESPTAESRHFLCLGVRHIHSSVPCGALMRPLPDSRWKTTGSGTFSFSRVNKPYCFI
ncbi:MAG: hypothetical protein NC216_12020 [Bacteroides sp.]|nr:hypothetical protein [Bacteroides sp.]